MQSEIKKVGLLLVDDEADFRKALTQGLSRRGYLVDEASNGEAALESIRRRRPDLVLLDQKMPGLSGIDTLRKIRKVTEDLPVIILTGYGDFNTALAGIKLDIVDFIQKPVDIQQLSERIQTLLTRRDNEMMREPTVAELMVPAALYPKVYIDDPLTHVLRAISAAYRKPISENSVYGQVRSVLVYDRDESFRGMIRFSNLLRLLIPESLRDSPYASYFTGMLLAQGKVFGKQTIKDLVHQQVFVDIETPLMEAIHLLVEHTLINIPVVDGGEVVGVLRARDIIIATARIAGVGL